jgi:small subunit ribosomal protein S16
LVKIRLTRKGNRKRPFYRVVVAEDSHRRDGRFIEIVGMYDPLAKPATIEIQSDAVIRWLSEGAQPTNTVREILKKAGVWAHWRAVQEGKAEAGEMTGSVRGTVERSREARPSQKEVAKVAEEASKKAEEAAAAAESEESGESEEENGSEAETADESKP